MAMKVYSPEPTYEELKPDQWLQRSMRVNSPEPTYEELKLIMSIPFCSSTRRPEPTYEELKRFGGETYERTYLVPSLPMRN